MIICPLLTLLFYADHVPDFSTASGFVDLLYLAAFAEVQEVLLQDSYRESTDTTLLALMRAKGFTAQSALRYTMSKNSHDMRLQGVWSRGRMRLILTHIFANVVLSPALEPWDLFYGMLANLIHVLKGYYCHAWTRNRHSGDNEDICMQYEREDRGGNASEEAPPSQRLFLLYLESASRRYGAVRTLVQELEQTDPEFTLNDLDGKNPERIPDFGVTRREKRQAPPGESCFAILSTSCLITLHQ